MRSTRFDHWIACMALTVTTLSTFPSSAAAGDDAAVAPADKDFPSVEGRQRGNASFYSRHLTGRRTASGASYDPKALTAAHRTLPLGTQVRVVNPKNDKSVVVTVTDRGPTSKNRMIDVSSAAAEGLGMKKAGVTKVETQVVGKTPSADGR